MTLSCSKFHHCLMNVFRGGTYYSSSYLGCFLLCGHANISCQWTMGNMFARWWETLLFSYTTTVTVEGSLFTWCNYKMLKSTRAWVPKWRWRVEPLSLIEWIMWARYKYYYIKSLRFHSCIVTIGYSIQANTNK